MDGREVPFLDVFVALSRGEPHLILPDGAYFSLDKPELQALARLIEEARALQDSPAGAAADQPVPGRTVGGAGRARRGRPPGRRVAAAGPGAAVELRTRRREASRPPGCGPLLRPYQLDGFRWLAFLWEHRLGGILADDMGLGKTLQTLALISHAQAARPGGAARS